MVSLEMLPPSVPKIPQLEITAVMVGREALFLGICKIKQTWLMTVGYRGIQYHETSPETSFIFNTSVRHETISAKNL